MVSPSDELDDSVLPNQDAAKRARKAAKLTQESLVELAAKKELHISKRTVENIESGKKKRVKKSSLVTYAQVVGVDVDSLIADEVDQFGSFQPGTAEFYLQAIPGVWHGKSSVDAGRPQAEREVTTDEFKWKVILKVSERALTGTCDCTTKGYKHVKYKLSGTVNGRGIVIVDGFLRENPGANDMFRVLLQFHNDTRTRTMKGGYVMYWSEYQAIFAGLVELCRTGDVPAERDAAPDAI